MKNLFIIFFKKKLMLALTFLLLIIIINPITKAGTFSSTATGNWGIAGTWTLTSGSDADGIPDADDVANITGGFTVTVAAAAACSTLTISASSTLIVGGFNFTVSAASTIDGTITSNSITGAKTFDDLIINTGGIFNSSVNEAYSITGNLQVDGSGTITSGTGAWTFSQSGGTISGTGTATITDAVFSTSYTNSGTFTFSSLDVTGTGTVNFTNNGTVTVTTTFIIGGSDNFLQGTTGILNNGDAAIGGTGVLNASAIGNFVNYTGITQDVKVATYYNLTLAGTGTKSLAGDVDVNNNLTINTGITLTASGANNLNIGGTWINNGTFTASTGTVIFDGAAQIIPSTTFNNLTISGAGVMTLAGATTIVTNLTLTNGTLATGTNLTMGATGIPIISRSGGDMTGTLQGTNDYSVTYTGNSKTTGPELSGSGLLTVTVNLTAGQTLTLDQDRVPDGNLTITAGIFDLSTFAINRSLATGGTLTVAGTLRLSGVTGGETGSNFPIFNTTTLTGGTVEYYGPAQTVFSDVYENLILSGSGVKILGGATTVNTNITVESTTSFNVAGFTISLAAATAVVNGTIDFTDANGSFSSTGISTLSMGVNGLIRTIDLNGLGPAASASLIQSSGTFTTTSIDNSGSIEYYRSATSGQIITDRNYNNLIISGDIQTKTWTLTAARTVNGNLTISANAPFTLAGTFTLNLKGNWVNNSAGAFTPGMTVINFNGSTVQNISGSSSTTYNSVTVNNSNGVTLDTLVTVSGTLTLTAGNINTTSTDLLTLASTGVTSGGSSTSFVNGPMAHTGTGSKIFPIGKGTSFRPVTLGSIVGTSPVIQAEVFNSGSGGTPGTGLSAISSVRHWQITLNNGSFTSGTVNLTYDSDDGVSDAANLRVAQSATLGGTYDDRGGSGSANTSGNITSSSVTTVQFFTLANATGGTNPLPVELSSFSASVIGSTVKLSWKTETEVNNYGFEIHRQVHTSTPLSVTGWEKIGFVNGNGNSNSPKSYSFVDDKVSAGKYSYRLKQTDNDGQFEYSKVIEVDFNSPKKFELSQNYPNPFNPVTTIRFNLPEAGIVKLTVYNILGQQVALLVNEVLESGVHTINFNASELNSGMYIYRIESGNFVQTRKMTLVK